MARSKTAQIVPPPEFRVGFFAASAIDDWPSPAKIALCLVLHQVGLEEKARLLREAWQVVAPGGQPYVADYGEQSSRSEEHPSALQSLMRSSYAGFCLTKKNDSNTPLLTRL